MLVEGVWLIVEGSQLELNMSTGTSVTFDGSDF